MSTSSKATSDAEKGRYDPPRESSGLATLVACAVCPPLIPLVAVDMLSSDTKTPAERRDEYDRTYERVSNNMSKKT